MRRRPDGPRRRLEDWKRTPVWRLLAPCTRLVLERMVTFGNGSGVCFPSVRTLAFLCNCHKATVERALAESKAVGILLIVGKPEPRKGVRGPGSVPYQVGLPPSVAELEEHVRVARGLRGREGRRLLTRGGIVRHHADNSRDHASGRFTAELSATVRTNKLSATMRTDPLVFPPEGKPEGKPDGLVRRGGAPPPGPQGPATSPGASQGDGLVGENTREAPLQSASPGGGPTRRPLWTYSPGERAEMESEGMQVVPRFFEAMKALGDSDGASRGGRVPQGQAAPPGSGSDGSDVGARREGQAEGHREGPTDGSREGRQVSELANQVEVLLRDVVCPGRPPGMWHIAPSTIRVAEEDETTEEERRESARQLEVLEDYFERLPAPPNEYALARLQKQWYRPELIQVALERVKRRGRWAGDGHPG